MSVLNENNPKAICHTTTKLYRARTRSLTHSFKPINQSLNQSINYSSGDVAEWLTRLNI
jgi:hypothetical protein